MLRLFSTMESITVDLCKCLKEVVSLLCETTSFSNMLYVFALLCYSVSFLKRHEQHVNLLFYQTIFNFYSFELVYHGL